MVQQAFGKPCQSNWNGAICSRRPTRYVRALARPGAEVALFHLWFCARHEYEAQQQGWDLEYPLPCVVCEGNGIERDYGLSTQCGHCSGTGIELDDLPAAILVNYPDTYQLFSVGRAISYLAIDHGYCENCDEDCDPHVQRLNSRVIEPVALQRPKEL